VPRACVRIEGGVEAQPQLLALFDGSIQRSWSWSVTDRSSVEFLAVDPEGDVPEPTADSTAGFGTSNDAATARAELVFDRR
jgi:hypothetical protein